MAKTHFLLPSSKGRESNLQGPTCELQSNDPWGRNPSQERLAFIYLFILPLESVINLLAGE